MAKAGYASINKNGVVAGSQLPSLNNLMGMLQKVDTNIPRPVYQPQQYNEVNALREQQAKLNQLAENPESDVASQRVLQGIQTALTRSQQSALGAAKGRAAASGQAGFGGAYASSAAALQAARGDSYAQAAAKLYGDLSTKSREQALDVQKSILAAEQAAAQQATLRAQLEQQSLISALNARVQQQNTLTDALTVSRGQDLNYNAAMKNSATNERQLDLKAQELAQLQKKLDAELGIENRKVGLAESAYADTVAQRKLDEPVTAAKRTVDLANLNKQLSDIRIEQDPRRALYEQLRKYGTLGRK